MACVSGESITAGLAVEPSDLQARTCRCSSSLTVTSSCVLSRAESTAAVSGVELSDLLDWTCSFSLVDWYIGLVHWMGASRECVL